MMSAENKIKVVVTGGAGFIGSHLADALIERDYEVHIIDDLSRGKRENINSRAVFHELDIRYFEKITPVFLGAKYVFHAAALPRVQPSIKDPRTTHDVNVNGTLNVLFASRDAGVKRVIYSASSSAYGHQDMMPFREDMTPRPLSPYGLQKHIGELYCQVFSRVYGLETVSLRYFSVYGPRLVMDGAYALVIGIFLEQRKRGEPLTVVSDGKQSRDFTHVRDIVRANLLAMESPKVGRGEIINTGGGGPKTVLEVAQLIGGPWKFIEPRLEPKHTFADITRARELLSWEPQVKFEEGIGQLKRLYDLA